MQFLTVLLLALTVALSEQYVSDPADFHTERDIRVFEDKVRKALECTRNLMKNGDPQINLPPLDPLNIPHASINFDKFNLENISGSLIIDNLVAMGISDFDAPFLKGTVSIIPPGLKLQYGLLVPKIALQGSYNINATIMGKQFFGAGDINLELSEITANGSVHLKIRINGIDADQFRVAIGVKSANLQITGLMDNPEFSEQISEMVSKRLPDILEERKSEISHFIEKAVSNVSGQCAKNPVGPACEIYSHILKKCKPL